MDAADQYSVGRDLLAEEHLPPVSTCLAYGSGAIRQDGYSSAEAPMLDLILVVDDAEEWHRQNFVMNRDHYAEPMRTLGPNFVSRVQRNYPAGVYFNTLLPMRSRNGQLMKYGVVSRPDLIDDLMSWKFLYLAGRLHKPVHFLAPLDDDLQSAHLTNLQSAARTALFLLPETFKRRDIFMTIAGLSYHGDFRMIFGENPDKVRNIVSPNFDRFEKLFSPVFETMGDSFLSQGPQGDPLAPCSQNMSPRTRREQLELLPAAVRTGVTEVDPAAIQANLRSIVRRSSILQSAKGLATSGVVKSTRYTGAKVAKWASWWGRRLKPW